MVLRSFMSCLRINCNIIFGCCCKMIMLIILNYFTRNLLQDATSNYTFLRAKLSGGRLKAKEYDFMPDSGVSRVLTVDPKTLWLSSYR
jgi:hypothetical protein